VLDIKHLKVAYGITEVLRDVTFQVPTGAIVALLGGNGSGKTTLLNTLAGMIRPLSGSVQFDGVECAGRSADRMVRSGLAQVPQGREVWPNMTVIDNLELGAVTRRDRAAIKVDVSAVFELFPKLNSRRQQLAGALSGGRNSRCWQLAGHCWRVRAVCCWTNPQLVWRRAWWPSWSRRS
jgi:branched-chain amino acid transport system ATP-binding protein